MLFDPSAKINSGRSARHHNIAEDDVDLQSIPENRFGFGARIAFDHIISEAFEPLYGQLSNVAIVFNNEDSFT